MSPLSKMDPSLDLRRPSSARVCVSTPDTRVWKKWLSLMAFPTSRCVTSSSLGLVWRSWKMFENFTKSQIGHSAVSPLEWVYPHQTPEWEKKWLSLMAFPTSRRVTSSSLGSIWRSWKFVENFTKSQIGHSAVSPLDGRIRHGGVDERRPVGIFGENDYLPSCSWGCGACTPWVWWLCAEDEKC